MDSLVTYVFLFVLQNESLFRLILYFEWIDNFMDFQKQEFTSSRRTTVTAGLIFEWHRQHITFVFCTHRVCWALILRTETREWQRASKPTTLLMQGLRLLLISKKLDRDHSSASRRKYSQKMVASGLMVLKSHCLTAFILYLKHHT